MLPRVHHCVFLILTIINYLSCLISVHVSSDCCVSHSPLAGVKSPGRHCVAEGLHRGVEEVLHTVRHLAEAFLSAGDHSDGQARQQQEVQRGGQHRPQGEEQQGELYFKASSRSDCVSLVHLRS